MFIIKTIKKEDAKGEVLALYGKIENMIGFLPDHFRLFATLNPKGLKKFLTNIVYFYNHERIDGNILPILRLYIANKEDRKYCIGFNTKLLLAFGYKQEILKDIQNEIHKLDFSKKQIVLMQTVLKALYDSKNFSDDDLALLYTFGFSDKDFFDIFEYCSDFLAKSKMIQAYIKA